MADLNHNPAPTFSIGVEVYGGALINAFSLGEIDARIAEQVAGKLLKLAHAVRAEARKAALAK